MKLTTVCAPLFVPRGTDSVNIYTITILMNCRQYICENALWFTFQNFVNRSILGDCTSVWKPGSKARSNTQIFIGVSQ